MTRTRTALTAATIAATIALAGCSSGDPLAEESAPAGGSDGDAPTIVVGSQDYYSSEIIAEIYAQALEEGGYDVERDFRIGQREAYLPELESGAIDLFPEYSGPLLQYWVPDTEARLAEEVLPELEEAMPEGLRLLEQSPATDQDAFVVTQEFADEWDLETIADLADVTVPLTLGANSEAETRPNGPKGLADEYGLDVGFSPIEDGGGPLTVKALEDGDIQLAIIYTADPSLARSGLVALEDTAGLFLASHVIPVASEDVDDAAAVIIDAVSEAMTPEGLVELNTRSVDEQVPAATIATDWLTENGLV